VAVKKGGEKKVKLEVKKARKKIYKIKVCWCWCFPVDIFSLWQRYIKTIWINQIDKSGEISKEIK
jgi:hypothetical protein